MKYRYSKNFVIVPMLTLKFLKRQKHRSVCFRYRWNGWKKFDSRVRKISTFSILSFLFFFLFFNPQYISRILSFSSAAKRSFSFSPRQRLSTRWYALSNNNGAPGPGVFLLLSVRQTTLLPLGRVTVAYIKLPSRVRPCSFIGAWWMARLVVSGIVNAWWYNTRLRLRPGENLLPPCHNEPRAIRVFGTTLVASHET